MNLNTIRIDSGQPLTEADLDARISERTGPQQITIEEADKIIRASRPARRADIDYALHTDECGNDWRSDIDAHNPRAWIGVFWLALCAVALLAIIVIALPVVTL